MLKNSTKLVEKNLFLEVKKSKNYLDYTITDNFETTISVLDLLPKPTDLNLHLKLGHHSSVKIIISSFASATWTKNYQVKIDHSGDYGISDFQCYVVASKKATVKVQIVSDIKPKTSNNNTAQKIKGVVLSDDAKIHGEPQLIIDDNNVKAVHAMAIGRINPNHLFYLMSKGLPRQIAIQQILMGYFNTTLTTIPDPKKIAKYQTKIANLFEAN